MLLHAETTGAGPEAVVLLHGMTGSAESWWRIMSGHDRAEAQAEYAAERDSRTVDRLRADKPHYGVVVRADPSHYVDDETAAALASSGVDVRSIPGAAHSVWYSHFDAFVAALPEVFDR